MTNQEAIDRIERHMIHHRAEERHAYYITEALNMAIEALKAQESRLMTLDEVIKHYSLPPVVLDDLNWQEDYLQDIEPLYFDFPVEDSFAVHWRGYQNVRTYLEDWKASYGQKWRCWTARPTEEQREAAKWDAEDKRADHIRPYTELSAQTALLEHRYSGLLSED